MPGNFDGFIRIVLFLLLTGIRVEGVPRDKRGHRHTLKINVEPNHLRTYRLPVTHFGYKHPETWVMDNPHCAGLRQSPIDLRTDDMARLQINVPFYWQKYNEIPRNMMLQNNGHTVQISGTWDPDKVPQISGGFLEDVYTFAQLHFHWGPLDDFGSEHTINNHSLPLEMHMIHYKKKYGSMNVALMHEDGLMVVGVLFEIGNNTNIGIAELENYASSIGTTISQVDIKPFPLSELDIHFTGEYVAYLGSLTTPPCSEIVTWIIPAAPSFLTPRQMSFFRNIKLADGDDHNCRPTMPHNGRMIYYISYEN